MVFPFREDRRGEADYLPTADKIRFRTERINELEALGKKLTRSDSWYLRYYREPYMDTFTAEQFNARWVDIQDNILRLNANGKVGPPDPRKDPIWMERFTDLIAESQFRGGISSKLDKGIMLQHFVANTSGKVNNIDAALWEKNYIFRFGQKKYNYQSLNEGKIRLIRSGRYSANDMNRAQKDDENTFTFSVMPAFLKGVDGMSGLTSFDQAASEGGVHVEFTSNKEYLVWCAAASYDARLPYAFDSDSVLIIHDRKRFERETAKALLRFNSELKVRCGKVRYFDPFIDLERTLDIPFAKHFRFSYQDEYRVVAEGARPPEELFLEIPKLHQYAEVVELR